MSRNTHLHVLIILLDDALLDLQIRLSHDDAQDMLHTRRLFADIPHKGIGHERKIPDDPAVSLIALFQSFFFRRLCFPAVLLLCHWQPPSFSLTCLLLLSLERRPRPAPHIILPDCICLMYSQLPGLLRARKSTSIYVIFFLFLIIRTSARSVNIPKQKM